MSSCYVLNVMSRTLPAPDLLPSFHPSYVNQLQIVRLIIKSGRENQGTRARFPAYRLMSPHAPKLVRRNRRFWRLIWKVSQSRSERFPAPLVTCARVCAAHEELRQLLQQRAEVMRRIGTVKQTIAGLANLSETKC